MALIDKIADRMLNLVAPKIKASACACSPHGYTQRCFNGCKDCHEWQRNCSVGCNCSVTCGACYTFGPPCC